MKPEQISDALNQLDDDLIYETAKIRSSRRKKKKTSGFNLNVLGTVAACLGLLIIGNIVVTKFVKPPVDVGKSTESTQMTGTETAGETAVDDTSGNATQGNETQSNETQSNETWSNETQNAETSEQTRETDSSAETTGEDYNLPILNISLCTGSDGSGSGSFVYDDISLLTGASPWSPELTPAVLPVYQNTKYSETFVPGGFTKEDMEEEAKRIVSALGEEMIECYYTEATTYTSAYITAVTSAATIVIDGKGYTTIRFEDGEISDITSLVQEFDNLLGFDQPEIVLRSQYDFAFSGAYMPHYIVYDKAGDTADNLLNRCYNYAEFFFAEDKTLTSIVLRHGLSCAEKIADYPIISPEEAKEELLAGKYFYQGLSEFGQNGIDEECIAGVDLIYLQSNQNQILIPYYCFYVLCPGYEFDKDCDPELIRDLEWYQDCYVPAVEGQYITDVPTHGGNLN